MFIAYQDSSWPSKSASFNLALWMRIFSVAMRQDREHPPPLHNSEPPAVVEQQRLAILGARFAADAASGRLQLQRESGLSGAAASPRSDTAHRRDSKPVGQVPRNRQQITLGCRQADSARPAHARKKVSAVISAAASRCPSNTWSTGTRRPRTPRTSTQTWWVPFLCTQSTG